MRLIKRRLVGKDGSERVRELRTILTGLPNYRNGPYADIRKWVHGQIDETRVRSRVIQRDSIGVRREGAAQVALVGPPNSGKSSLLNALSHVQIKIGDYAFTTLRPVPALTRIGGVLVQLVEIPGLISGASEDRGGGRALLGVLRGADAIVYCHDVNAPLRALFEVRAEVAAAGISRAALLAATKLDEAREGALAACKRRRPTCRSLVSPSSTTQPGGVQGSRLGTHRLDSRLSPSRQAGRRRAPGSDARRDDDRRGRQTSPEPGCQIPGRSHLGTFRPIRRA